MSERIAQIPSHCRRSGFCRDLRRLSRAKLRADSLSRSGCNPSNRAGPFSRSFATSRGFRALPTRSRRLCPSIARDRSCGRTGAVASGFAVSPDGWVVAATSALPSGKLEVAFRRRPGDCGHRARSDPVSGLSILKTDTTGLRADPPCRPGFPARRDFGFAIDNPAAAGCSAQAAMIASDFLTDGGASSAYIRLQPMGAELPRGSPFISASGRRHRRRRWHDRIAGLRHPRRHRRRYRRRIASRQSFADHSLRIPSGGFRYRAGRPP